MAETAQASPGGLMSIGEVASRNIAQSLGLQPESVKTIELAIRDEITAMSSHFTLAIADVQTAYEIEVAKVKSEWTFIENNQGLVAVVLGIALVVGFVSGAFVGAFA